MSKQLQAIHREMRDIVGNPNQSPKDKRQKLDQLTAEKNTLLESVVWDVKRGR